MIWAVTTLWAYCWVQGESLGKHVGFGPLLGHYVVDQVTFAPVQGHYPVNVNCVPFVGAEDHDLLNLNHVRFVGAQDHYRVSRNHVPFVGAQDHSQVAKVNPACCWNITRRSLSELSSRKDIDLCSQ